MNLQSQLIQEWNRIHGSNYELREHDLAWNLSRQNLMTYQLEIVAGTPVLLAQATSGGVMAGIPANNLWLSLWGEIKNEAQFISELDLIRKRHQKKKLVIGGDEFHLFPGVPATPAGLRFRAALQNAGFEEAEAADYFGDIQSAAVKDYIAQARSEFDKRELSFKEVTTPAEISTAHQFLLKEFPGRWAREFQFWSSREDTQRAYWKLLRTKENEVIGFARMAVRGRVTPLEKGWTPGALRVPTQLTQPTHLFGSDCCLGPIGVASSQRGQGTGKVLLGLVLESLRNYPGDRICIDWTNAFKYYEPLKFEIARRYWTSWRADS